MAKIESLSGDLITETARFIEEYKGRTLSPDESIKFSILQSIREKAHSSFPQKKESIQEDVKNGKIDLQKMAGFCDQLHLNLALSKEYRFSRTKHFFTALQGAVQARLGLS